MCKSTNAIKNCWVLKGECWMREGAGDGAGAGVGVVWRRRSREKSRDICCSRALG